MRIWELIELQISELSRLRWNFFDRINPPASQGLGERAGTLGIFNFRHLNLWECPLTHQSGSETSRTHLHFFGLSFDVNSHGLEVRIPAPFRFVVGMAYIIARNRPLTTYFTYLRHSSIPLCFFVVDEYSFGHGLVTWFHSEQVAPVVHC